MNKTTQKILKGTYTQIQGTTLKYGQLAYSTNTKELFVGNENEKPQKITNVDLQININSNTEAINNEITNRQSADSTLQSNINTLSNSTVKLTGDQTIDGVKTFNKNIYCGDIVGDIAVFPRINISEDFGGATSASRYVIRDINSNFLISYQSDAGDSHNTILKTPGEDHSIYNSPNKTYYLVKEQGNTLAKVSKSVWLNPANYNYHPNFKYKYRLNILDVGYTTIVYGYCAGYHAPSPTYSTPSFTNLSSDGYVEIDLRVSDSGSETGEENDHNRHLFKEGGYINVVVSPAGSNKSVYVAPGVPGDYSALSFNPIQYSNVSWPYARFKIEDTSLAGFSFTIIGERNFDRIYNGTI